jgi:hypothetical protein
MANKTKEGLAKLKPLHDSAEEATGQGMKWQDTGEVKDRIHQEEI